MINDIQLVRNIGIFDSMDTTVELNRLTLIYAENGRGKTTISAILRSLQTGDSIMIEERQRLASAHPPHVVLDCEGDPSTVVFENNSWNRSLPNIAVFDDSFVNENVFSGLSVEPGHRQNLHQLIIGSEGVRLRLLLESLIEQVERHNTELRRIADSIPDDDMGGLSVDDFCALPARPNIDDEIEDMEKKLAAANEQEAIRDTQGFDILALPSFDLDAIESLLYQDLPGLDTRAAEQVQTHLASVGEGAEEWVAEGMERLEETSATEPENCPFCDQDLAASQIIGPYRDYFGEGYSELMSSIADTLSSIQSTHGGRAEVDFERAVITTTEKRQFWSRFCDVPEVEIDTSPIISSWQNARDEIVAILEAKQSAPLDRIQMPQDVIAAVRAYESHRVNLAELNGQLQESNSRINEVKISTESGNADELSASLVRLKAIKARYTQPTADFCQAYLDEKAAKSDTETRRDESRASLNDYQIQIFPDYQATINRYLTLFNAGFRLDQVIANHTRHGPTCTYSIVINETPVPVAVSNPTPGEPTFESTLSSGDRNTLALAFFFASLDHDTNLSDKIVIIDDPVSSLDDHRSLTTIQEMRRLVRRVSQVLVMSHNKQFLCRIWNGADRTMTAALIVDRDETGSTITSWDVSEDSITAHDRRHVLLSTYLDSRVGDQREVAQALRPHVEAYLRVTRPEHFRAGDLLGPFINQCRQCLGAADEILDAALVQDLDDIKEYANRYHHDTNPAWETEEINDGELAGFVQRVLTFTR